MNPFLTYYYIAVTEKNKIHIYGINNLLYTFRDKKK